MTETTHDVQTSKNTVVISSSRRASSWVRRQIKYDQEELWILALSASKRLIEGRMLFRGTADACLVHPRDIFRFIFETNAVGFIMVHNHPSDEPLPSEQDWTFTERIQKGCEVFQIVLLDHLIVTRRNHTSLRAMKPHIFFSERCQDNPTLQASDRDKVSPI